MSSIPALGNAAYGFLPMDIDGFDSLAELALDMRWSWNHGADKLWRLLEPGLWDLTQNPWAVLQTVSREQLESKLADPAFRRNVEDLLQAKRHAEETHGWFKEKYPQSPLTCIAYFSMEFMLSEALPIYSGGLGNVAGDQMKAASDLGVPLVGVGLLYQQGYFRQVIDKDGAQQALYPYNDPGQLPITPVRKANGEWLRLEIALPGYSVWLRAWQVQVGRVRLYLLDSNDAANFPVHRGITSELYGGGPEVRLKQEILLGIGGWRLLGALGLRPEVCHLNEGHAALAVLERARGFMEETGQTFEAALATTRAGNIFTTHTAVAAGFDRFSPALIEQYLKRYTEQKLKISLHDLMALGRQNPRDTSESFNMAYLAIRGSAAVNGVSRLHGEVSRQLFGSLFPRWPVDEVPVGHVTNGIHTSTWDSAAADELWTEACGKDRWLGANKNLSEDIRRIPDARLWEFRAAARKTLIEYTRVRLARQLALSGATPERIEEAKHLFDPNVLTLGFARRFATYKRPNLLLHNSERLLRLLSNSKWPVQLIIAGKAHPDDHGGQALIQEWIRFINRDEVRVHVIFLSDYDMFLSQHLVQGVDVWVNTPRRPWEACGTSGMKVLVNGGINLSELDGWWVEAYSPDLGWAIGDGQEHGDDSNLDHAEAQMLYETLEQEVIPEFYTRNSEGIPTAWIARMRESMARLTPQFSANRAVREYTEQRYVPGAKAYLSRSADSGRRGKQIFDRQLRLNENWCALHFGEVTVKTTVEGHLFQVQLCLGNLGPLAIRVELFANGSNDEASERLAMNLDRESEGASGACSYSLAVTTGRSAGDYTIRVVPQSDDCAVPLESTHILWQR